MKYFVWILLTLCFLVASIGGGCSTFGQSFVTSSDGASIVISSTAAESQDKPVSIEQELPDPVIAIQPVHQSVPIVAIQPVQTKQWFLVSEPWCSHCPAAKRTFLLKGWPVSNVLTIAQCKERFGFSVPYVPYEFGMDVSSPSPRPENVLQNATKPYTQKMSHSEMVSLHNSLHGGGSWTWPGDLENHLREQHGVSTTVSKSTQTVSRPVQRNVSSCPNGVCPTRTY